jgi:mannose-6-phosphate isomerase-like protein (cupin superfamily)
MPFPRRKTEKACRKTRLLTNDGMLKILCLDVEGLFGSTRSNSLNNAFANLQKEMQMSITRRDLCLLLPATLFPAVLRPEGVAAQEGSLPSAMYPFEKLPIRTPNNAQIRDVLKGKLATGESLEVHETTLPPGGAPHAAHHHVHSEMWLIREGTVELTVNGTSYHLGPGSVGFVHSNDEHGIKNVGTTPATYFVVAVGPGASS